MSEADYKKENHIREPVDINLTMFAGFLIVMKISCTMTKK